MEAIVIIGFFAIVVGSFVYGMKEQLIKNTEADRRELEGFRKKALMAEGAKMAAEAIKNELREELKSQRFAAAVEAAVEARIAQAGQHQQAKQPPTWKAQAAKAAYEKPQEAKEEPQYIAAEYQRDQEFPDHREM